MNKDTTTTQDELFQYIHDNVQELQQHWTTDFEELYGERIWDAYLEECAAQVTELSPKEFVESMDSEIGWDWVTDEDFFIDAE